MGQFSIGDAWSQAMAFLMDNLQALVMWIALPIVFFGVISGLFFNVDQVALQAVMQRATTTGDFAPVLAAMGGVSLLFVSLASIVIQTATQFAATRWGLGHREDAGSLISFGLGAAVLSLLFYFIVAFVIGVALVLLIALLVGGAGAGGGTTAAVGVGALLFLILLPALLWLSARLSVAVPAMADARSANPLFGLAASWRLTAANQWAIFGYYLLLIVAAVVLVLVISGIAGVLGALIGTAGAAVVNALLVSAPVAIVSVSIAAGIYRTLAPSQQGSIFS